MIESSLQVHAIQRGRAIPWTWMAGGQQWLYQGLAQDAIWNGTTSIYLDGEVVGTVLASREVESDPCHGRHIIIEYESFLRLDKYHLYADFSDTGSIVGWHFEVRSKRAPRT